MPVREMNNHMWTKDNVKKLLALWDTKSMREIADEIGVEVKNVQYMAHNLRLKGFPLAKKHVTGQLQTLLNEVAEELGIEIKK